MTAVMFLALLLLLALGVPVAMAIGIAGFAAILAGGGQLPVMVAPMKLFSGLDSFPMMAIPFFILAAEIMTRGALADVLLRFATQFVGHVRGGVGHTGIFTLTIFSGIGGSAVAAAAGPGAIIMRMMDRAGYGRAYPAALVASASVIDPIIPPSIVMIVYALADDQVSVMKLFLAGICPGLLIACALFVVNHLVSVKRRFPVDARFPALRQVAANTWRALPALFFPVIILGGIHGGFFTPTEASAVAVFYALAVGAFVYRTIMIRMVPTILLRAVLVSSAVMIIIAMSQVFAFVLTLSQIPQTISLEIAGLGLGQAELLLLINLFLLVIGMFLDPVSAIVILVPILAPLASVVGIDATHFAIVVIVNVTIGLLTPPVGQLLFVTAMQANVPILKVVKETWPFLVALLVVLLVLILFPVVSTGFPRLLGY